MKRLYDICNTSKPGRVTVGDVPPPPPSPLLPPAPNSPGEEVQLSLPTLEGGKLWGPPPPPPPHTQ